jgi:predicted anti-sigma-YlaC factor YlaD
MTCEEVVQMLQNYLDAEVENGTATKVSLHLGDCRTCGVEYSTYRDIKETLVRRAQPAVDPLVMDTLRRFCQDLSQGRVPDGWLDPEG